MSNAIFFITHIINDNIVKRYNKIKNDLSKLKLNNYCVIFACPDDLDIDKYNIEKVYKYNNSIVLPNTSVAQHTWFYNPCKVVEKFFLEQNNTFDYYYVIEYDVEFSGDWSYVFKKCNKYDVDLIGDNIKLLNESDMENWWFGRRYLNNYELNNLCNANLSKYYNGCFSFYRISNKALTYICNSNNKLTNYIYEMYYPTLLLNENFTYINLSDLELVHPQKYKYDSIIKSDKEMDIPNKLYAQYKL